jgi:hypothetical protein
MIYFLYWVGIFIFAFALCTLIKVQQYDEDELPFTKEQLHRVIQILLIIGSIFLVSSLPFINYKKFEELNRTSIQYIHE